MNGWMDAWMGGGWMDGLGNNYFRPEGCVVSVYSSQYGYGISSLLTRVEGERRYRARGDALKVLLSQFRFC